MLLTHSVYSTAYPTVRTKLTVLIFVFCLFSSVAFAQPNVTDNQVSPIDEENVEELIVTLESESARAELIDNLKTLREATDDQSVSFSLTQALNLDAFSSGLIQDYNTALERTGLSSGFVSKLFLILLVALVCWSATWFNKRIAQRLDTKANRLRSHFDLSSDRFKLLFKAQVLAGSFVAVLLFAYTTLSLINSPAGRIGFANWGVSLAEWVAVTILLGFLVILIWEGLNAALEYGMSNRSSLNSTRVETLLPVIRNISLFFLLLLLALVTLSELGIDIVPILAGAGVLGIAVGFGAQTMVKDFLTGFIIVLEDLIQVGDVIKVGGRKGRVEKITLRKIQLRSLDGTVHTVPHSEVNVVDNYTKEYAFYMMDVGVAYKEDIDKVIDCLVSVDEDVRTNSEVADHILEPLEVLGVDEFADSAVVIKVRTKTKPHAKWLVGREFNRRIKMAFDAENIEIPFPHRTVYINSNNNEPDSTLANNKPSDPAINAPDPA